MDKNGWKDLLGNNATRMIRNHCIKKFGKEAKECPMKIGKRCRPKKCKQAWEDHEFCCEELALSAHDLAYMSLTYDFADKGYSKKYKRKQSGKLRIRQTIKAYEMMHIWWSGFCLKCKIKENEWCSQTTNKGTTYNPICRHPKRIALVQERQNG